MSTDFLTCAVDWSKYGVVFADCGHNVGPSGCCIVVVRDSLLKQARTNTPAALKWKSPQSAAPCSDVFVCGVAFDYMLTLGGIPEMEARAKARSEVLYRFIDDSKGYFINRIPKTMRSWTNVSFTLSNPRLAKSLCSDAEKSGLFELQGQSTDGQACRASLFNGMPFEGVFELTSFLQQFKERNQ